MLPEIYGSLHGLQHDSLRGSGGLLGKVPLPRGSSWQLDFRRRFVRTCRSVSTVTASRLEELGMTRRYATTG